MKHKHPDVTDGNTFTQLANGIVGFNTTMNIGNMNFSNMNSGGTAYDRYGYGIYLEGRNNKLLGQHQPTLAAADAVR